jgi:tetratricopeptide (TPR) repeat protein
MSKRKHAIEAAFRRAVQLQAAGQAGDADRLCREILAAAPAHADSLHMLGVLALQAGQPQLALAHFDQAIAVSPRATAYHLNRAGALHRVGRSDDAIAACREALRLDRNSAEAHQVLGHVLSDLGRGAEAIAAYREAARRKPGLFDIHNNLGVALRNAGRLEEAEQSLRQALRREPGEPGITANLSSVLKELGRITESEACLRDALRSRPDDPVLRYNLGLLLLLTGDFQAGWAEYEARVRAGAVPARVFRQPAWTGEALNGRTLLVHAEQGLGDTIQFCRYLPLLVRRLAGDGQVVFEAQRPLARLMAGLVGAPVIARAGEPLPPFDLVCPLLSLPERFGTTVERVPRSVPYLAAESDRVARWRERLGLEGGRPEGIKVGIAWQGNPGSQAELGRSVPLAHFLPLGRMTGVRLISLQKHHGLGDLAGLPFGSNVEVLGDEFDAGPDAFLDTAAIMASLDLIITSDTSIAHLAGALGRPVWVALQYVPDWRWILPGADSRAGGAQDIAQGSPWYPTMRLFRQTTRGDWAGVFADIATALGLRIGQESAAPDSPSRSA